MYRTLLLSLAIGFLFFVSPAHALSEPHKAVLKRIERYLSDIHTIASEFTQGAPSGELSTGKFYLQRPGKLRMEYDPPTPVLMVAGGGDIAYYDKQLDQVSHISLDSTLVSFLARESVAFDESVVIKSVETKNNGIRISLVQSKHPKDGTLTLEFTDKPMELKTMRVTDNAGQVTTVALNNARFNTQLDRELFIFKDPHLGKKHTK